MKESKDRESECRVHRLHHERTKRNSTSVTRSCNDTESTRVASRCININNNPVLADRLRPLSLSLTLSLSLSLSLSST